MQNMELIGFELGQIFPVRIIYFLITTFVGAILLHLATGILNFEKRRFTIAFAVVIVGGIVSLILTFIPAIGWLLGLIAYWYFIKILYSVGWGKAILAWIMSILVAFIIAVMLLVFLGLSTIFFF